MTTGISGLFKPLLTLAFTSLASFGLCAWAGVRFNSTGSLPVGGRHGSGSQAARRLSQ